MAGHTVDNQLKGAAEETTAAATVTAGETATTMEMVTVTARIRTATPMLKGFLVGTEDCFQRGSFDFLVSVRYVVFGGGCTIFLVWGFANKRLSRTFNSVYDLRRETTTENTLRYLNIMFCWENVSVPLYLCILSSGEGRKPGVFMNPRVIPTSIAFWSGWRERMESSTEKTLRWNTIVIGDFLNLGGVFMNVANINSYVMTM